MVMPETRPLTAVPAVEARSLTVTAPPAEPVPVPPTRRTRKLWVGIVVATTVLTLLTVMLTIVVRQLDGNRSVADAVQRCGVDAAPDVDAPLFHDGKAPGPSYPAGENPANGIFPGDAFRLDIDDAQSVTVRPGGPSLLVDGQPEPAPDGYPYPAMPRYGVVFRLNNLPQGWVAFGANSDPAAVHALRELAVCTAAPDIAVRLFTGMNDDNLADNTGHFYYRLKIWRE